MTRQARSQERFKYGICLNDECPKCKQKTVQQVPMRKDLVCSECGKEMRECPPPKKGINGKRIAAIVGGLLAVAAIVLGIIFLPNQCSKTKEPLPGNDPTPPDTIKPHKELTLNHKTATLYVGDTDTLKVEQEGEFVWRAGKGEYLKVEGGIVTALKEGSSKVAVQLADNENAFAVCEYTILQKEKKPDTVTVIKETVKVVEKAKPSTPKPTSVSSQSINLGYATYQGATKNGKPDGNGMLIFKRTAEIIPGSGDYAERGETVVGQFRDGKLIFGTWNKNDGNRKVVKR